MAANLTCYAHASDLRRWVGGALFLLLAACSEPPPSWQKLLAGKIIQQYPQYQALPQADGSLLVKRPGLPDAPVDVEDIARFCRRGPADCNYITDKMLLELGDGKRQP